VTITDADTGTLSFAAPVSTNPEGTATHQVGVTLHLEAGVTLQRPVSVEVVDAGTGSADQGAGLDYTYTSPTTVTFAAGSADGALQHVELALLDDDLLEGDETIDLDLQHPAPPTGADVQIAAPQDHQVTLTDADALLVEFNQASGSDLESSGGNLPELLVTGEVQAGHSVDVDVTVTGGTATSVTDFSVPMTLTVGAGSYTAQAFAIPGLGISDDSVIEPDETVLLGIDTTPGDVIAGTQSSSTYTINNDDSGTLEINDVSQAEGNSPDTTDFIFAVTLTGVVDRDITVQAATADGTATVADNDYTAKTEVLTFSGNAATPQTRQFIVSVTGDSDVELDESFVVNLTEIDFHGLNVTITDAQGNGTILDDDCVTEVLERHIFYNNSSWDGNDPGANAADDDAIHPAPPISDPTHPGKELGKQALLPGQTASFVNYTSYFRGINGIMIDFNTLSVVPTVDDFEFKVGNDNNPSAWADAPDPVEIALRPVDIDNDGTPDVDRVTIIWEDYYVPGGSPPYAWVVNPNGIGKQWLQVRVLASGSLGLAVDDVFYFGNAIGEAGNSATEAMVNAIDEIDARTHPHWFLDPAPVYDPDDFNRDKKVDATDQIHVRSNQTFFLTDLNLITTPASAPPPGSGSAPLASAAVPDSGIRAIDVGVTGDNQLTGTESPTPGPAKGTDRWTNEYPVFDNLGVSQPSLTRSGVAPFDQSVLAGEALKQDLGPASRFVPVATTGAQKCLGSAEGSAYDTIFEEAAGEADAAPSDREDLSGRLAWLAAWDEMGIERDTPADEKSREAAVDEVLKQFEL